MRTLCQIRIAPPWALLRRVHCCVALVALFAMVAGCHPSRPGDVAAAGGPPKVAVAAAADLRFALEEIRQQFQQLEPGVQLDVVYGSSGKLYSQIAEGAPFNIYMSADRQLVDKMAALEDVVVPASPFVYARGHLVLWATKDSGLNVARRGREVLLADNQRIAKIAIANPEHAPYGRAAEAALRRWEMYEQLQSRLVFAENVSQALQFVQSGAADIGFVPLSMALAPQLREQGDYWELAADDYPPLDQAAALLQRPQAREAAQKFFEFLKSQQAQSILQQYGFSIPRP